MAQSGAAEAAGVEGDAALIAGVMDGVKQSFIDEGVDPEVLERLQQLWLSKLSGVGGPGLSVKDVILPCPPPRRRKKKSLPVALPAESEDEAEPGADLEPAVVGLEEEGEEGVVEGIVAAVAAPSTGARPKKTLKKSRKKVKKLPQVDGPADSSDEEDGLDDDDDGDDDDDDDDDDLDPDGEEDDEGVEEDPLGSEDDISDEDASDLFETDNVVVCQYDKITRARNKWKFHLKDGIMNLNGKDYVFQRANGDAEW